MAHFAQIVDGVVTQTIVVNSEVMLDADGNEVEQIGIDFCKTLYGQDTDWVQTSVTGRIRKNYAAPGSLWDGIGFCGPRPYPSWTLDENYQWQPPVPFPSDIGNWNWNEDVGQWERITPRL